MTRELLRAQESELAATQRASDVQEKLKHSSVMSQSYETQIRMLEEQLNTAVQRYIQKNRLVLFKIILYSVYFTIITYFYATGDFFFHNNHLLL